MLRVIEEIKLTIKLMKIWRDQQVVDWDEWGMNVSEDDATFT